MNDFNKYISETFQINSGITNNIILSLVVILLVFSLRKIINWSIFKIKGEQIRNNQYKIKKVSSYVFGIVNAIFILFIWFEELNSILTFLGVFSAVLVIVFKEPLVNVVGWFSIIGNQTFAIGDRIIVGQNTGDVVDISFFQFTILEVADITKGEQSTGRIIHIPNSEVFFKPLTNYYKAFKHIWIEIPVIVTFESDWKLSKNILEQIATKHGEKLALEARKEVIDSTKKYAIQYNNLTPKVYTKVVDFGVELTVRYLCEPRNRRDSEQSLWEDILDEFGKSAHIDFAYPTRRAFNNLTEGKVHTPNIENVE